MTHGQAAVFGVFGHRHCSLPPPTPRLRGIRTGARVETRSTMEHTQARSCASQLPTPNSQLSTTLQNRPQPGRLRVALGGRTREGKGRDRQEGARTVFPMAPQAPPLQTRLPRGVHRLSLPGLLYPGRSRGGRHLGPVGRVALGPGCARHHPGASWDDVARRRALIPGCAQVRPGGNGKSPRFCGFRSPRFLPRVLVLVVLPVLVRSFFPKIAPGPGVRGVPTSGCPGPAPGVALPGVCPHLGRPGVSPCPG